MSASRTLLIGLLAFAAGGLLIGAAVMLRMPARSTALEVRLPPASAIPADGRHIVSVAGAVQRPGLYPFVPGDRIADAIVAAGGAADGADLLAINLARRLRDEDQVVVPRQGEAAPVQVASSGGVTATGRRIDVNTASPSSLESLPGIGSVRAQRIVESRQKDGPFSEPADLVRRKIIPQSVLDDIIEYIDTRS